MSASWPEEIRKPFCHTKGIDFVYDVGMQSPCLRRKVKLDEYVPLNRYQKIRACTKKKKKNNKYIK